MFEVGAGSDWFEVLCALRGLRCSAIELSPLHLDVARSLAAEHGVEVDIRLGDIETDDIGVEQYDYIIAASLFEHVRHYGLGLARLYEAFRPGGVLYFSSTNEFSPRSGELRDFPLYGWWPYRLRKRIRINRHGSAIIESSGMDFNQFTYAGLRKHSRSLVFGQVDDPVEYSTVHDIGRRHNAQRAGVLRLAKLVPPAKWILTTFARVTSFICVK